MMEPLNIVGWVIAVGMGIINLIIVYLVIPTKKKVSKLKSDFHLCQIEGTKKVSELKAKTAYIQEKSERHEGIIESLRDCTTAIKVDLSSVKEATENNTNLLTGLDGKMDRLLKINGR